MSPTDREIKVVALAKLLQDRTNYIHEIENKEAKFGASEEEIDNLKEVPCDVNAKIILQETKDLVPLVEEKIKEVSADIRSASTGETNDVVARLLSEADQIKCSH